MSFFSQKRASKHESAERRCVQLRQPNVGELPQPILTVVGLTKHFPLGGGSVIRAVDDLSFTLRNGETLGIVGESGCGKSTTARLLIDLIKPDSGTLALDGEEVGAPHGVSKRDLHQVVQMVFQDSYASLNPRLTLEDTIAFGPRMAGLSARHSRERARGTLQMVGLSPDRFADRYPHELSGGQRQRVNIARALAMRPGIVIFDEAVSALDKSVEAQVLNLLQDLKRDLSLTYIFISHDLNVVRFISDRVLVMYLGKVVELGPVEVLYNNPSYPYTRALLASAPSMNPRERRHEPPLQGDPPSPIDPPSGCRFRTRCPFAEDICARVSPTLTGQQEAEHLAACLAVTPGSGHSLAKLQ